MAQNKFKVGDEVIIVNVRLQSKFLQSFDHKTGTIVLSFDSAYTVRLHETGNLMRFFEPELELLEGPMKVLYGRKEV